MSNIEANNCSAPELGLVPGSAAFRKWWHNIGSGMPPRTDEDMETHTRRLCEIAWNAAIGSCDRDFALLESGTILLAGSHFIRQDLRSAIEAGMREANAGAVPRLRGLSRTVEVLKAEVKRLSRGWRSDQRLFLGALQLLKEAGCPPDSQDLIDAADRSDEQNT